MLCIVILYDISLPTSHLVLALWCRVREREIEQDLIKRTNSKQIIVTVIVFSEYSYIYLDKSNRLAETVSERLENGNFDNGVVKEISFCKQKVS